MVASLLTEVCSNIAVEPGLQQLSGEEFVGGFTTRDEGAQMDMAADGFGALEQRTILVFEF